MIVSLCLEIGNFNFVFIHSCVFCFIQLFAKTHTKTDAHKQCNVLKTKGSITVNCLDEIL